MKVVTTFHPPSSVIASLRCDLSPSSPFQQLVIARTNRIEIHSLTPEGLRNDSELEIWGRVLSLRAIPADVTQYSNILVLTDHPDPQLIILSAKEEAEDSVVLETKASLSLFDRNARSAEFLNDVFIHPDGSLAVVSCYVGKLKIVHFDDGDFGDHFDIAIPELNLLSLAFVDNGGRDLAMLHLDHKRRIQLLSREIILDEKEISAAPTEVVRSTALSGSIFPQLQTPPILVSVPSFPLSPYTEDEDEDEEEQVCPGGVILLGGREILFYELSDPQQQRIRQGKHRRLEKRKASMNEEESTKAVEKEKEREKRKAIPRCTVKWPWSEVTAWCTVDADARKYLIGDKYGRLSLLTLDSKPSLILLPIGEVSPPTSLTYLTSQIIYVGSHLGDSQLVRIHPAPLSAPEDDTIPIPSEIHAVDPSALLTRGEADDNVINGKQRHKGTVVKLKGVHIEILEKFRNIAPIMDAVLADVDKSGQPQIVTCSGGNSAGSLNVIQTGADFAELAVVRGITEITNIWPIRPRFESTHDSHLLASTYHETYVFRLDGVNALQRLDPKTTDFVTSSPTLAVSNFSRRVLNNGKSSYTDSAWVVQVTAQEVRLLEYVEATGLFHNVGDGWVPKKLDHFWNDRGIVAADINPSQVVLGLTGGRLALLNSDESGQFKVQRLHDFRDPDNRLREIRAISCQPFDPTKAFTLNVAVSFWESRTIAVLALEATTIKVVCETEPLPSLPQSIILHNFGTSRKAKDADCRPYVIAGLTNGTVASFSFTKNGLQDKKVFSLGSSPVSLSTCEVDGQRGIFACGSRSAAFYLDKQRLRPSPIALKDLAAVSHFNHPQFPSSVIVATESSLIIGKVRGVAKMQVRQVPLGFENPRRIAYNPSYNAFGVACAHLQPSRIGDADAARSLLNIYDATSYNRTAQFGCEPEEEISAIVDLSDLEPTQSPFGPPFMAIGTFQHLLGEREPSKGRIVVFSLEPTAPFASTLHILTEKEVNGCVWAMNVIRDRFIVAAVNSSVILYELSKAPVTGEIILHEHHVWNHNYFVTTLAVRGDYITVGDSISSVSILELVGTELRVVARDYGPLWPSVVGALPDNGVIGANADCNLFTFSLERDGDRRAKLSRDGFYYLGEMVNKLIQGSVTSRDAAERSVFEPEHIFFTSSGRIGQIIHVNDENVSLTLTGLQRNLGKYISGAGDIRHSKYRTPAMTRGRSDADTAIGFLDGDFLEQFLSRTDQSKILRGEHEVERITASRSEIQSILESLQSLH
ncbi:hypothetical protein K474DRAFT_1745998 [Panus rudis PR-1116 ss-1]|nr:hypothetical protein K474DRAFT_1745998 [Panus rudis PR-1116 ss-1]